MAERFLIAGVNRISSVLFAGVSISQALNVDPDNCSFQTKNFKPNEGDEVIIESDELGRLFGGIIDKVQLTRTINGTSFYKVDIFDYVLQFDRYLVVETYRNVSADFIAKDIVAKYCGGFTINNIRNGAPIIEEIIFDYKRPSECFKELCDYVGWEFYVDYFRDVWFFDPSEVNISAPNIIEDGVKFRNLKHTIDTQGLRNRVYVRGGTMLSDPFTYEVKADGSARIWTLPHKPHEITFNLGNVGIENVHKEEDFAFLMNYQEKYVRASEQTSTPAQGTTLSFTYKYDIDVITMVEDIESQQAIASVQGGDGVYEHVIVDESLVTIDAAEAAGNADLRQHANPRVKGSFETEFVLPHYTWGSLKEMTWGDLTNFTWGDLVKHKRWEPGQLVTIDLPDRGIQGTYLIQRVTITPITPDKWTFRVEYGGRLLGIADFLKALVSAQQKKKLNDTAILHKFSYGQDKSVVTDEITGTSRTPPFKCGDPDAICGFVVCA